MTEQQSPHPVPTQPTTQPVRPAGAAAATEDRATPPGGGTKARRWLAGAMLVTVGLVAGSGATYAFTSDPATTGTGQNQGRGMRGYGFPGGGPMGTAPGSGDQGTVPGTTDPGTTDPGTGAATTGDQPT
ncbi:hypothetical protein SAMN04488543_0284 [Friedmanniella luteola]|uniref:Uncharacterized protein n=1 Tax=Friedmanniella luteola TaxID=546871 RepID=A0A1H1LJW1_9ACTN|nr:hypothetical protein [Friedmanniella luteola]SDR74139.1 hypothetical protein SAMN04488543_0284 [Friedmanniella luteola]